ncbi:hypothetical protein [Salinarimonas sp.]|uniref:hypothetical protein n=1 Tax=Salinarimonas sp. TaxID=2766526 RepID=UPI00391B35AB
MNRDAFNLMLDGIDRATGNAGTLHRVTRELQHTYMRGVKADREQAEELLQRAETLARMLAADVLQVRMSFDRTYADESEQTGGAL